MKLCVIAVHDSALNAFMRPMCVPTVGVALRMFTDEVNRAAEDNPLNRHPEDHTLHVVAEFDEERGVFLEPEGGSRALIRARDVLKG